MNRRNFGRISGVLVDVCREHGVWFDAGELSEVLSFIENGGLARTRERESEEREEAKRAARSQQMLVSREAQVIGTGGPLGAPVSTGGGWSLAAEFVSTLAKIWD
jgi:Zn-finger nucleic acid-binding protein